MRFETHSHSHYSNIRILDCLNKPEDLILKSAELGCAGIALTDHEALCGHIEWLNLEKQFKEQEKIPKDFRCALGNEIYLVPDRDYLGKKLKYWHFILIAKDTTGWQALRELSSGAWLHSYRERGLERVPTTYEELEAIVKKYPGSLIATTACLGSRLDGLVLQLVEMENQGHFEDVEIIKGKIDDFITWCISLFGDDFYIELAPGISKDQKTFNKRIKSIANFYKRKLVIGTDAHYLTEDKRAIHKAFLNAKEGEREVDSFYHDTYLMSDDEAYSKLKDIFSLEEFKEMCQNSMEIYRKIGEYDIFHNPIIPEVEVPVRPVGEIDDEKYPNLTQLSKSDNLQERYWVSECARGLLKKDKWNDEYLSRLEIEADVIRTISESLGNCLFSYFNTFQHYIDLFWECGSICGPGRGSACGFLSNYLLGITQIDPIKWDLPWFRFLNKDRVELPDIDCDLCSAKRPLIFKAIRKERGELNLIQVATFGVEAPKASIACACRGYRSKECPNGIDVDVAQYLSGLIPVERGMTRSIRDCIFGNEDKGWKPIRALKEGLEEYPGLLEIVMEIENVVCRRGQHASGVMMYNHSPYDTTALMRSPNGDLTTQFDLHKSEQLGDTKFDYLVTEISDKLSVAIDLLKKDGYFPECKTKREIYEKYFHPESIDVDDPELWRALAEDNIQDVFQFNTQIGKEAIKAIQPHNPQELTATNALIRLSAPEGQDRPYDRYIRFKKNINLWYKEMDDFGLTKEEQKILEPYYLQDYGVPASQEALMRLCMDENISHFTLGEANATRKVVAKKQVKKIPELREKFIKACPSERLGQYAWRTMMEPQMSYSFSLNHATPYSFVGIQTVLIASKYPSVYWNCACLIVNSSSAELFDDDDIYEDANPAPEVEEDEDGDEEEGEKKKNSSVNYGKIAKALGELQTANVIIEPPHINTAGITFTPNAKSNTIIYGLKGIAKIGDELITSIIANRPYTSISDFLSKVKLNKTQMVNLIKSGAFDDFGTSREEIMEQYIRSIADQKKELNLRNMEMLIKYKLLPDTLAREVKIYNFNKYIKKNCKVGADYRLQDYPLSFFTTNFDVDLLRFEDSTTALIDIKKWDKIYSKIINTVRDYIKENKPQLLQSLNEMLYKEVYDKYCLGTISKWEMDSISYYSHPHELAKLDAREQGWADFFSLPEEPEVASTFRTRDGKTIPLFKIERIAGTVLDRDKTKRLITILTTTGVVTVRMFGDAFTKYDRQISEIGEDGKKHVIEKSFFSRGSLVILCGIRRGSTFISKKYKSTPYHLAEKIIEIDGDTVITQVRE